MSPDESEVAILGTGKIGIDLVYKVLRSPTLERATMVGRNPHSAGLRKAMSKGIRTSAQT